MSEKYFLENTNRHAGSQYPWVYHSSYVPGVPFNAADATNVEDKVW